MQTKMAAKTDGRRFTRQFWFLFGLIMVVGVLLAYRTEANDRALSAGLHEACVKRAEATTRANERTETLIQLVLAAPSSTVDPAAKEKYADQLRGGMLRPVEQCD
jgi:hypothetical protein